MAIWLKLLKTLTHTHTNKSISLEVVQRRQMVTGPLSYWLLHILAAPTLACWFTFLAPARVCIARSRFRGNTRQTVTDHLPPDCIFSVHRFTSWWFTFVHCSRLNCTVFLMSANLKTLSPVQWMMLNYQTIHEKIWGDEGPPYDIMEFGRNGCKKWNNLLQSSKLPVKSVRVNSMIIVGRWRPTAPAGEISLSNKKTWNVHSLKNCLISVYLQWSLWPLKTDKIPCNSPCKRGVVQQWR